MLIVGCASALRPNKTLVQAEPSLSPSTSPPRSTAEPVQQNQSPRLDGNTNTIAFGGRIGSPVVQADGTLLFDGDIFTVGVDGSNLRRLPSSGGAKGSSWRIRL